MSQISDLKPPDDGSLVQCAITPRAPQERDIEVSVYADMMITRQKQPQLPNDEARRISSAQSSSRRGRVTSFSRKSRKRMIDKMAQKREYVRPIFLTLTYPDEIWFDRGLTMRNVQMHLDALIERFKRRWPDCAGIWRKEAETRKSGENIGLVAPHLHLIVDGIMEDIADVRKWLNRSWTEIVRGQDIGKKIRTDVQVAKSRRHATYYVSKYVAKEQSEDEESIEDFVNSSVNKHGRHWGLFGNWQTTPSVVLKLTYDEWVQLKRLAVRWLKSRGQTTFARRLARSSDKAGFSVYSLGDESCKGKDPTKEPTINRMLAQLSLSGCRELSSIGRSD